jgi:protein-S-isoprenylcysteine O-methyltransferase Ste14
VVTVERSDGRAGAWNHVRAVLLLPLTNTVGIPAAIAAATGSGNVSWIRSPGVADVATLALAAALLAGGAALVVHSIRLFVRLGRGTLAPWDPTRALVAEGAYRYMRNPMKAGLFLVLFAEAALLRSLPLLVWFVVFVLVNVVYIRVSEEPGLRARFGAAYDRYCVAVPRWLPSVAPRRRPTKPREAA